MRKTINIAYRDKLNKNGWRLPFCVWKKMFKTERIKELFKTNSFYIYPHISVEDWNKRRRFPTYTINQAIGKIISIDFDNLTADIEVNDDIVTDGYSLYFSYYLIKRQDIIITSGVIDNASLYLTDKSCYTN